MVAKIVACGGCDLLSQALLYTQALAKADAEIDRGLSDGSSPTSSSTSLSRTNSATSPETSDISDVLIQWTCRNIDTFICNYDDSDGKGNLCQEKVSSGFGKNLVSLSFYSATFAALPLFKSLCIVSHRFGLPFTVLALRIDCAAALQQLRSGFVAIAQR